MDLAPDVARACGRARAVNVLGHAVRRGLAAVDFLMPSYYVWAKIIEALADLGYDPNMLVRPQSAAHSRLTRAAYALADAGRDRRS